MTEGVKRKDREMRGEGDGGTYARRGELYSLREGRGKGRKRTADGALRECERQMLGETEEGEEGAHNEEVLSLERNELCSSGFRQFPSRFEKRKRPLGTHRNPVQLEPRPTLERSHRVVVAVRALARLGV